MKLEDLMSPVYDSAAAFADLEQLLGITTEWTADDLEVWHRTLWYMFHLPRLGKPVTTGLYEILGRTMSKWTTDDWWVFWRTIHWKFKLMPSVIGRTSYGLSDLEPTHIKEVFIQTSPGTEEPLLYIGYDPGVLDGDWTVEIPSPS